MQNIVSLTATDKSLLVLGNQVRDCHSCHSLSCLDQLIASDTVLGVHDGQCISSVRPDP